MNQDTTIIFSFRTSPEGGYEARALGHSIFTQAETMEGLGDMIREALLCHFDREVPYLLVSANGPCSSS